MADHAPLAIRPWSKEDNSKQDVATILAQLINHKGGFLDVTEESLEEEIRNGETQNEEIESIGDKEEDEQPKGEQIQAAKAEILKFAQQAFTESGQALDLISLLLTKYAPTAEASISPFVKQALPLATLGAELIQPPIVSESKRQRDGLVSTGWKLEALNVSVDSILKSATKLEEEMKKEARYWDQVLAIKDKGWAVSRMPREHHTLGVRFGFLESAPEYLDKSMAALRRDKLGNIDLDLGTQSAKSKTLQACVVEDGKIIAVSRHRQDQMEDDSIETAILHARNSIFDAELFSEMLQESRGLRSRGVAWGNSRVTIPLQDNTELIVELSDRSNTYAAIDDTNHKYNRLPKLTLIILRILLSHSHSINHKQRISQPAQVGDKHRARVSPALLRPLLSFIHHRYAQQDISSRLMSLSRMISKADIQADILPPRYGLDLRKIIKSESIRGSEDLAHTLMAHLTKVQQTALPLKVSIGASAEGQTPSFLEASILIRTRASGSEYRLLLNGDYIDHRLKQLFQDTPLPSIDKVMELLRSSVQTYLARAIAASSKGLLSASTKEGGDIYVKSSHTSVLRIELDLNPTSLKVLCSAQTDAGTDMSLEQEWTKDLQASEPGHGLAQLVMAIRDRISSGRS